MPYARPGYGLPPARLPDSSAAPAVTDVNIEASAKPSRWEPEHTFHDGAELPAHISWPGDPFLQLRNGRSASSTYEAHRGTMAQNGAFDQATIGNLMDGAERWLLAIRNRDKGWGPYEGHPSRIVTTCEALLSLKSSSDISRTAPSVKYLVDSFNGKTPSIMQHERHYAYTALALMTHGQPLDDAEVNSAIRGCLTKLSSFRNGGGFVHFHASKSPAPAVFATYLGMEAITEAGSFGLVTPYRRAALPSATRWLIDTQNVDNGWGFSSGQPSTPAATAFAVLSLDIARRDPTQLLPIERSLRPARLLLLDRASMPLPGENEQQMGGNAVFVFDYFSTAWVAAALFALGERPWNATMSQLVTDLLSLRVGEGGWRPKLNGAPTVWATYAAVRAWRTLLESFSPQAELLAIRTSVQHVGPASADIPPVRGSAVSVVDRVVIGHGSALAVLSKAVFLAMTALIATAYTIFWVLDPAIQRPLNLLILIVVTFVSGYLTYKVCRGVFRLGTGMAATLATAAAGIAAALDLVRQ